MSNETVEVEGTAIWTLVRSQEVRSDVEAPVEYTFKVTSTVTASKTQIEQMARERTSSTTSSLSLTAGVAIKMFTAESTTSYSWTSTALDRVMSESSGTETRTQTEETTIGPVPVAPGTAIYIFEKQLQFPGGIQCLGTKQHLIESGPNPPALNETVRMRVPITISRYQFLERFNVEFYDDAVSSAQFIQMARGSNSDINKGYGGKFVYMVPQWTQDPNRAASRVSIHISGNAVHNRSDDLAKGAGGDFRYVNTHNENNNKIIEVKLWDGELHRKPDGWDGQTIDINKGRGGRYLYVVWKTTRI